MEKGINAGKVQAVREKLVAELEKTRPLELDLWPSLFEDLKSGKKVPQSLMLLDFADSIGFEMGLDEQERFLLRNEIFLENRWFTK